MRNIVPDNRCVHGITIGVRCTGCESGKCHHGFPLDRHCPTCATFHKPTPPKIDKDDILRQIRDKANQTFDGWDSEMRAALLEIEELAKEALKA